MTSSERPAEFPYLYAALVLVIGGVFVFSIHSVLSPIIAYIAFLLLLAPYVRDPRYVTVIVAATFVLAVWLLETLGSLLAPFVLAFVLAYILDPIVDLLERTRLSRVGAIAAIMVPMTALVVLAFVFGIPALVGEINDLIEQVPAAAERAALWIEGLRASASRWNLPFISEETIQRWLDPERMTAEIAAREGQIAQSIWGAVSEVGRGISAAVTILGFLVLTPVLMVYLLKDFDSITTRVANLVPDRNRARWVSFAQEFDRLLSRFLRGQLLQAAMVGIMTWIGLTIARVPYAGVVGLVAGVFNLVPYLGLVVSCIPVLIIALFSGSFISIIVRAAIVFAIVQAIDSTLTGPRIVGTSVGLHPVWVILALAVGGSAFGLVGLLIAVPATVLIKLLLKYGVDRYRSSSVYAGTGPTLQ